MAMPDVGDIIAYENGEMSDDDIITFFQGLIPESYGVSRGFYGRMAAELIQSGYCTPKEA